MLSTDPAPHSPSPARRLGLRSALRSGHVVSAVNLTWPDAGLAEALCLLGFDCVILDGEHAQFAEPALESIVRACHAHGSYAVLRTPVTGPALSRCLDIGVDGVSAPSVSTVAEARAVVDAVKYPPQGSRGVGAGRSAAWGLASPSWPDLVAQHNAKTVIMLQIEDVAGAACLPEILDTLPEIDVVIVGALDLSQSLGVFGEPEHPLVRDAVQRIVATARAAGRAVGLSASAGTTEGRIAAGATYVVTHCSMLLEAGAAPLLDALRPWIASDHPSGEETLS